MLYLLECSVARQGPECEWSLFEFMTARVLSSTAVDPPTTDGQLEGVIIHCHFQLAGVTNLHENQAPPRDT